MDAAIDVRLRKLIKSSNDLFVNVRSQHESIAESLRAVDRSASLIEEAVFCVQAFCERAQAINEERKNKMEQAQHSLGEEDIAATVAAGEKQEQAMVAFCSVVQDTHDALQSSMRSFHQTLKRIAHISNSFRPHAQSACSALLDGKLQGAFMKFSCCTKEFLAPIDQHTDDHSGIVAARHTEIHFSLFKKTAPMSISGSQWRSKPSDRVLNTSEDRSSNSRMEKCSDYAYQESSFYGKYGICQRKYSGSASHGRGMRDYGVHSNSIGDTNTFLHDDQSNEDRSFDETSGGIGGGGVHSRGGIEHEGVAVAGDIGDASDAEFESTPGTKRIPISSNKKKRRLLKNSINFADSDSSHENIDSIGGVRRVPIPGAGVGSGADGGPDVSPHPSSVRRKKRQISNPVVDLLRSDDDSGSAGILSDDDCAATGFRSRREMPLTRKARRTSFSGRHREERCIVEVLEDDSPSGGRDIEQSGGSKRGKRPRHREVESDEEYLPPDDLEGRDENESGDSNDVRREVGLTREAGSRAGRSRESTTRAVNGSRTSLRSDDRDNTSRSSVGGGSSGLSGGVKVRNSFADDSHVEQEVSANVLERLTADHYKLKGKKRKELKRADSDEEECGNGKDQEKEWIDSSSAKHVYSRNKNRAGSSRLSGEQQPSRGTPLRAVQKGWSGAHSASRGSSVDAMVSAAPPRALRRVDQELSGNWENSCEEYSPMHQGIDVAVMHSAEREAESSQPHQQHQQQPVLIDLSSSGREEEDEKEEDNDDYDDDREQQRMIDNENAVKSQATNVLVDRPLVAATDLFVSGGPVSVRSPEVEREMHPLHCVSKLSAEGGSARHRQSSGEHSGCRSHSTRDGEGKSEGEGEVDHVRKRESERNVDGNRLGSLHSLHRAVKRSSPVRVDRSSEDSPGLLLAEPAQHRHENIDKYVQNDDSIEANNENRGINCENTDGNRITSQHSHAQVNAHAVRSSGIDDTGIIHCTVQIPHPAGRQKSAVEQRASPMTGSMQNRPTSSHVRREIHSELFRTDGGVRSMDGSGKGGADGSGCRASLLLKEGRGPAGVRARNMDMDMDTTSSQGSETSINSNCSDDSSDSAVSVTFSDAEGAEEEGIESDVAEEGQGKRIRGGRGVVGDRGGQTVARRSMSSLSPSSVMSALVSTALGELPGSLATDSSRDHGSGNREVPGPNAQGGGFISEDLHQEGVVVMGERKTEESSQAESSSSLILSKDSGAVAGSGKKSSPSDGKGVDEQAAAAAGGSSPGRDPYGRQFIRSIDEDDALEQRQGAISAEEIHESGGQRRHRHLRAHPSSSATSGAAALQQSTRTFHGNEVIELE